MTVRDPGFDPRGAPRRDRRKPAGGRRVGAIAGIVALLALSAWLGGVVGESPAASPGPNAAATAAVHEAPAPTEPRTASPAPAPSAAPSATPLPPPPQADLAIVPVTNFRSGRTSVTSAQVKAIANGASPFGALVLVRQDEAAILSSLGLDPATLGTRLTTVESTGALAASLAQHRTWLGFLRADDVTPAVHALAWGSRALFGEGRVASLAAWSLTARLEPAATMGGATASAAAAYDPAAAWTLFAAGDLALDRGAYVAMRDSPRGADFLYDGGTATITGHCKDCSPLGWDLPNTRRTGNNGLVRSVISGADLAIANMEEPAPDHWTFHPHGTTFTGNPALISGIANAGFDWVSLANNHVGNAGPAGVLQTMANLDKFHLLHGGAGANIIAAHTPSIVDVKGVKVGIVAYDTVTPVYNATSTRAGSARMTTAAIKSDIAAARKAGAQVVIVFPHWGTEYTTGPNATQQKLAHAAIDAGADLVIGNHPHWAQVMEVYKGKPIWYALGNFTFDQDWSEPTMEGISLEMTFRGATLAQVRIRPHLVLARAQPNFMDPLGAGKVVMDQVFGGAKGLLPW